jgi:hypothetical protein
MQQQYKDNNNKQDKIHLMIIENSYEKKHKQHKQQKHKNKEKKKE